MSVYKKLSAVRKELAATPLKKSGYNQFGKWAYFQLDDFLPTVIDLFDKHGLCDAVQICRDAATLSIYDAEGEGVITFSCQVPEPFELKGQNPVQLAGSVQTYLRRYLYVTALAISENDVIDQGGQQAEQKAKDEQKAAYDSLVIQHMGTITEIKTALANGDYFAARCYWNDFDEETKMALWKAKTKGGVFTTEERDQMKSTAFRTAEQLDQ